MNRLVSHIEFLLHEHNCVIIPEFGGFVVNSIHSRVENGTEFCAPTCELVFNRDLTYNDGLMAQSYMKTYQLSFESSTLEIQKGVRELKHRLHDHKHVVLGQLGSFTMQEDKRFVYKPAPFDRPSFFGLDRAVLKPLAVVQPNVVPLNPSARDKKMQVTGISVAAVAVIAVLLLLLPMSDSTTRPHTARMLSETEWFRPKQPVSQQQAALQDLPTTEHGNEDTALAVDNPPGVKDAVTPEGSQFYIVMGVFTGNETATKLNNELKEKGFTRTGLLERSGRIDVYAASFTEEDAAKIYLKEIHGKYPAYADAWILKR